MSGTDRHAEQALVAVMHERQRQREKGYTPEHDDAHSPSEFGRAAAAYAVAATGRRRLARMLWPWPDGFNPVDPRDCLIRSAALALAGLERMHRAGMATLFTH